MYHQGADTAYLLLYIDDIILTASAPDLLQRLTARLHDEFALKGLGPLHYFLGIEVVRRTDGFFLHQQKYAHELLERAGMLNCKPAPTLSTRRRRFLLWRGLSRPMEPFIAPLLVLYST